jgi:hypothetical protein
MNPKTRKITSPSKYLILRVLVTIKPKARRNVKEESSWLLLALAQDCLHKGLNLHIRGIRGGRLLENLGISYRIGLLYRLPASAALMELGRGNLRIDIPQENLDNMVASMDDMCGIRREEAFEILLALMRARTSGCLLFVVYTGFARF